MEQHLKIKPPTARDMIMCGDHPSITKTELNVKDDRADNKFDKYDAKEKAPISYTQLSPSTSRTDRLNVERSRTISEHALRALEARRRARSVDVVSQRDEIVTGNKALVQAALGSFRWPPYLVAVWVLVLLLTHLLHCVVNMLERALPAIKKLCNYFRNWTEESWKSELVMNQRVYPIGLASVTGLLYAVYCVLYAAHAATTWAIDPLYPDDDKREDETKVTDYVDQVTGKTNSDSKQ